MLSLRVSFSAHRCASARRGAASSARPQLVVRGKKDKGDSSSGSDSSSSSDDEEEGDRKKATKKAAKKKAAKKAENAEHKEAKKLRKAAERGSSPEAVRSDKTGQLWSLAASLAAVQGATQATQASSTEPSATAPVSVHPAWPALSLGSDDISAMSVLHAQLKAQGCHVADEEVDDWMFGESTREALLTAQACARPALPETGVTDGPTWVALLGAAAAAAPPPWKISTASDDVTAAPHPAPAAQAKASSGTRGKASKVSKAPSSAVAASPPVWPALCRDDGGAPVALLHRLLASAGYHTDEDEAIYWSFGTATDAALRTFQACTPGLQDTGVCDAATWKALAGPAMFALGAAEAIKEQVAAEEDMTQKGVYLLGEGRWEHPSRAR